MQWFCLSLLLSALDPPADVALPVSKEVRIDNFQLRDPRGRLHQLSDWRDHKLVVVAFLGVECPLARLYGPRLAELASDFTLCGVAFVAIDSNQTDGLSDLERYSRLHHLPFPFLKDVGNLVADQFGAQRSPEVFVLDERRIVRYRGRIDDQYGVGVQRPQPTRRDLAIALNELLAGQSVSQPGCAAGGCRISRVSKPAKQGPVTYCRDIAPILQQHCQTCHRAGQIAPLRAAGCALAQGFHFGRPMAMDRVLALLRSEDGRWGQRGSECAARSAEQRTGAGGRRLPRPGAMRARPFVPAGPDPEPCEPDPEPCEPEPDPRDWDPTELIQVEAAGTFGAAGMA